MKKVDKDSKKTIQRKKRKENVSIKEKNFQQPTTFCLSSTPINMTNEQTTQHKKDLTKMSQAYRVTRLGNRRKISLIVRFLFT